MNKMKKSFPKIKIMSLNVRGLNDRRLRRVKFTWIRRTKSQIIFLQETLGSLKNENYWKHEWGNKIIFYSWNCR